MRTRGVACERAGWGERSRKLSQTRARSRVCVQTGGCRGRKRVRRLRQGGRQWQKCARWPPPPPKLGLRFLASQGAKVCPESVPCAPAASKSPFGQMTEEFKVYSSGRQDLERQRATPAAPPLPLTVMHVRTRCSALTAHMLEQNEEFPAANLSAM